METETQTQTRSVVVQKNAAVTSRLKLSQSKLLASKVGFASGLLPLDYPSISEMLFGKGCINFWLFVALHLIAGLGLFYYTLTWKMALLVVASYYYQMFGVTGGYHRYFSHRSFKTGRAFQFVLAWLAQTSIQKGMSHNYIQQAYPIQFNFNGCVNFRWVYTIAIFFVFCSTHKNSLLLLMASKSSLVYAGAIF